MKARHIFAAFAAVAALAACSRDFVASSSPDSSSRETIFSTKNVIRPYSFSSEFIKGSGSGSTVQCSIGESTKTHLDMNADGSYANVVWDAGDSFDMFAYYNEQMFYSPYTTASGGADATFTASEGLPSVSTYYSIYPECIGYADLTSYGYGMTMLVDIPSEQSAVAGGFASRTNPSFCVTETSTEHLKFYNVGSVLKFRLAGGLVPSINTVTLKGASPLSGPGCALIFYSDGSVEITYDFGFDGTSNKITLNGPFVAGEDYYIVLAPGTQSSLSLSFTGDDGVVTKTVSQPIDFPRGTIRDFGTIDIGNVYPEYDGPVATKYISATSGLTPVTMVVVPDGFTKTELADFDRLAKSGIDALFATEPFKTYKSYFNVWLISVASNESGANITDGNGNITTARDCYFGSKWGAKSYDDMDLDYNILYNFVSEYCPDIYDGTHTIAEVPVLVIINDERYGGICHSWSNGMACCQAPVTYGGGALAWSYPEITAKSESDPSAGTQSTPQSIIEEVGGYNWGDWRNTLVHEYGGHCFSKLGDEYWYDGYTKPAVSAIDAHSWSVPFSLNISATYSSPPWKADLLDRKDQLVASNPLYSRLGVYQGGDVSPINRWRCERISCMIDNRFYFSAWQREVIVKRIMTLAGGTFNLSQFLSLDNPVDPKRDVASSGVMDPRRNSQAPAAPIMPPLPPPVLHD